MTSPDLFVIFTKERRRAACWQSAGSARNAAEAAARVAFYRAAGFAAKAVRS